MKTMSDNQMLNISGQMLILQEYQAEPISLQITHFAMKKTLLSSFILLLAFAASAQYDCTGGRYRIENLFTVNAPTTVVYGSNVDLNNAVVSLDMDIYEPAADTAAKRPCIFFTHGGSFIGGTKADGDVDTLCRRFASMGYVTVSMSYRLGMGFPNQTTATTAVLRAVQDMKAALRYFYKDASTANVFKIDTNYIFAGGSSAGAFMALHVAYLDQLSEIPSYMDTTAVGCGGALEGHSGNPGYSSRVRAVVNLCGALGDKTWMKPNEEPLCSMHGTADQVVPYGTATLYVGGVFPIMPVDGSSSIHAYALSQGGPFSVFHSWAGAPHVPYAGDTAIMNFTVLYVKNFLLMQIGCTADTSLFNLPTSVQPFANSEIKVFPNPSLNKITIELDGYSQLKTASIYSMQGQLIKCLYTKGNQLTLFKSDFGSGMFIIELLSNDGLIEHKKIIFE